MKIVNIHAAKTQLSRLVEEAAKGEPFIIAKAGKPMVEVRSVADAAPLPRSGFMRGEFTLPDDDFDTMMAEEIEEMFYGSAAQGDVEKK